MVVKGRQQLGREGEETAALYLQAQGFSLVDRNVRTRWGEIDLIAAKKGEYYFVEVKTRRDDSRGSPVENFPWFRQKRLRKMAAAYAQRKKISNQYLHLSLMGIDWSEGEPAVTFIEDIA